MEVNPSDRKLIEQVTDAMQAGAAGQETMMSLFNDDAVLVEPFGGAPQAHEGIDAIRARYSEMVTTRPPDFRLMLDRVDTDGTHVIADWTCTSVVLPAPLAGQSRYIIRDGKIQRLEIGFKGMPPQP